MRQAITKNQALNKVCPAKGGEHLGDNNMTYGTREDYVRVSLATNGTSGHYELLKLKHIRGGEVVDVWTIDMTEARHIPKPHPRPDIDKGGYYWSHDGRFYCWEPAHVVGRVEQILEFTGVLALATS